MANIIFTPYENPSEVPTTAGFKIGRKPSVFVNGLRFRVTSYKIGYYSGSAQDTSKSYSIGLLCVQDGDTTNTVFNADEVLNPNRLLRSKPRLNAEGLLRVVDNSTFGGELSQFLVNTLGRREDDPTFVNGTPEQVGSAIVRFFDGKVVACKNIPDVFDRDRNGRLFAVDAIQFSIA